MDYSTYSPNDWRDYYESDSLEHGWGWTPKMKAAERKYNAWYWDTHREKIMAQRRRRQGLRAEAAKKSLGVQAVEEGQKRKQQAESNKDSNVNLDGWREKMAEYKARKANKTATPANFELQKEEKSSKGKGSGGSKSSKSPEEIAAAAAEKERKKQEKEEARREREAERERKKKEREEDRATREADRERKKKEREEDRQYREEERERKKKEREEAAAEKERTKKEKEAEKKAKQEDDDRYNELLTAYRKKNIDDETQRSAINNYHSFRKELEDRGHSKLDDDTGKKLWNKFKREVARPKDSEVNENGFIDKDVRSSLLKKYKKDPASAEKEISNYSSFVKALKKAGHSEISKEEGVAMWKEFKKKLGSAKNAR